MSKQIWKHLFFDLDNTLWDLNKNSENAFSECLNHFFPNTSVLIKSNTIKQFSTNHKKLWQQYAQKEIAKKSIDQLRFSQLDLIKTNCTTSQIDDLNNYYIKKLTAQNALLPDARDTLEYLKHKGYILHIISNGIRKYQIEKLKNSSLVSYFSSITTSEEIGYAKPDKRIFQAALSNNNAKKKESIVIGDSLSTDILGAKQIGISSIHIDEKKDEKIVGYDLYHVINQYANQKLKNINNLHITIHQLAQLKLIF